MFFCKFILILILKTKQKEMNKENRTNRNEEYPRKQTNSNNKEEFSKEELSSSGEIKEGLENASSDESSKPSIQNNVPTFQGYLIKKGAVRRNWKRVKQKNNEERY